MNAESTMSMAPNDCWEHLRRTTIGRLAVVAEGAPDIFPVNYAVEHSSVVLRTGDGTKVDSISANPKVAFEIDGIDAEATAGTASATAWSVVLRGEAKEITRPEELRDTVDLEVFPLQSGTKNHFIRIVAEAVTGRRFPVTDAGAWETSLRQAPRAPKE